MNKNYDDGNIHWMDKPGSRLRVLRKEKGLSQVQLAELVGIDQSTISDIENGGGLSAEYLMRLCDALDTTPQYVMRGRPAVDEVLEQIRALVTTPQTRETVKVDRMGKPDSKVLPEPSSKGHNDQADPEFGPALTKFFNQGRGKNNGRSSNDAAASKSAAPSKKRVGGRS